MKIGILTHHYINNYGAFLQGWALQQAIRQLYPSAQVEIIDFINLRHFLINSCGWLRFYRGKESLAVWREKLRVPAGFARARRQSLPTSRRCFTAAQVNALGYDCIVVGSDEVWNLKDKKGRHPIKFGAGLTCGRLVAYAPSVGQTDPAAPLPPYARAGIRRFAALSARDEATAALVAQVTGQKPTPVLDPTFLAPIPAAPSRCRKPYILFYYCEKLPPALQRQIFDYAARHGLAVYGAGEADKRYTECTVRLDPFAWAGLFREAEFVFTGTFHGAVFSILNRRPFKVWLTNESRIQKVGALLRQLGITGREMGEDFVFDLPAQKDEIDYEAVYKALAQQREQSLRFLRQAIGGAE